MAFFKRELSRASTFHLFLSLFSKFVLFHYRKLLFSIDIDYLDHLDNFDQRDHFLGHFDHDQ